MLQDNNWPARCGSGWISPNDHDWIPNCCWTLRKHQVLDRLLSSTVKKILCMVPQVCGILSTEHNARELGKVKCLLLNCHCTWLHNFLSQNNNGACLWLSLLYFVLLYKGLQISFLFWLTLGFRASSSSCLDQLFLVNSSVKVSFP